MRSNFSRGVIIPLALLLVGVAAPAHAASLNLSQIESFITSFGGANDVANVATAVANIQQAASINACITLSSNLSIGKTDSSSHGQVTELQEFLGLAPTGYYGSLTAQLVQNFQSSHNIISSGTPNTTGYGALGPMTRSAMACSGNKPQSVTSNTVAPPIDTPKNPIKIPLPPLGATSTLPIPSLDIATSAWPPYTVVAGGTSGAPLLQMILSSSSGVVTLQKLGLTLSSGNPSDLSMVYIYAGGNLQTTSGAPVAPGTLLGTAVFQGNNTSVVTTLTTPVQVSNSADAILIVKGDVANIGTSQPGNDGDLVKINYQSAEGVSAAGDTVLGTMDPNYNAAAGVRMFKSYPVISQDTSLSSTGVGDGRLIEFKVAANSTGPVGIDQFSFTISPGASVTNAQLHVYVDPAYSVAASGNFGASVGQFGATVASVPDNSTFKVTAINSPLQIAPGQTYYFVLEGSVSTNPGVLITTTLNGDASFPSLPLGVSVSDPVTLGNQNFIWSSNATSSATLISSDYTNGYGIAGLPASGISQVRTSSSLAPLPPLSRAVPFITSVTPNSILSGNTVYLFGSNFDQNTSIVLDGNSSLIIPDILATGAGGNELSFVIPTNTPSGNHVIQVTENNTSQLSNSVIVTVNILAPLPHTIQAASLPSCTLTTSPSVVPPGGIYTLFWNATNALSQKIVLNSNSITITPVSGSTSGSEQFSPTGTWVMNVSDSLGNTSTCQATVGVSNVHSILPTPRAVPNQ